MKKYHEAKIQTLQKNNRGVVLPVVLLMLLMVSFSGLGSLKASRLTASMTTSYKSFYISFYNAETLLQEIETGLVRKIMDCGLEQANCESNFSWIEVSSASLTPSDLNNQLPQTWYSLPESSPQHAHGYYNISQFGAVNSTLEENAKFYIYQVVTRAGDGFGTGNTALQSILRICLKTTENATELCQSEPRRQVSWRKLHL